MIQLPLPSALSLETKIGQMLEIGFPAGKAGLDQLRRGVKEFRAGNVILFSRNISAPRDVHGLCASVRQLVLGESGLPPFVAVDQEGGIVARLREGVTPIPGAMAQAAAVAAGARSRDDIRRLGRICGTELAALGINWNLAPVADVNVNPSNPVIGVRSYGDRAELVAELASAFAAGLAEAGVMACAKHFPGHGDTAVDSHLGLPLIPHDLARLEAVELLPFRRLIAEGIASVMTAHVRFPAIEAGPIPATLSRKVIQGLLREGLGFRGLVVTDCMEMRAIADNFPEAAVMAVEAGADIIDLSHTYEVQAAAAAAILGAVRSGRIPESRIDESLARILVAKSSLPPPPATWAEAEDSLARPESLAFSAAFHRDCLAFVAPGKGLPPAPGALYIDVVPENLTGAEDSRLAAEGAALAAGKSPPSLGAPRVSTALAALAAQGIPVPGTTTVSLDPSEAEIEGVLALALATAGEGRDLVLGLYGAGTHPGQVELATRLAGVCADRGRILSFVSLRSPYDAALVAGLGGKGHAVLCAFEYTKASASAVADFLCARFAPRGGSPVTVPHNEGRAEARPGPIPGGIR